MIKKLLSSALLFSSIMASSQTFTATYSFAATTTVSGTTDPTPPPVVTGLTCGSFMAVGTPSANPNAGGRFSFVGWPTGATTTVDTYSTMTSSINLGEYYEVTLTPQAGYTVTYNSIAFTVQRSGTGIRSYAVRSSADGFTNNLPAAVLTGTNLSVVGANEFFWNFDAITSAQNGSSINLLGATTTASVSFRFYGWNSETGSGTFSIDNVAFNGSTDDGICSSPTITTMSSNSPICANQTLTLQSTIIGDSPITYTWTGAGSFGSANSASTTVTGATSTEYTLSVTNICGTATAVITPTVNSLPVVSLDLSSINLQCVTVNSVTLVGGSPSSGVYSGTGVTSGVFSPSSAGVGTHTITYAYTDGNNCTASASDNIVVDACTGIASLSLESFNIYPNPNSGILTIKSPVFPANVNVIDINGKQVISKNITSLETVIDLSNVVNGVYQLNIITEQQSFNYKIMINK